VNTATWILAALGSTGLAGAVVALLKLRPESTHILVNAAQGAVIVQTGVIDDLREQLIDTKAEITTLRGIVDGVRDLRRDLEKCRDVITRGERNRERLELERDRLREGLVTRDEQVLKLQGRVAHLEETVAVLRAQLDRQEGAQGG
jgi:chromosome segregation ATPase